MGEFRRDLASAYGSISYRRQGAVPAGIAPRGEEARSAKKRLTEELDEWITSDASALSVEQARMLAQVDTTEQVLTPSSGTSMSPQDAEQLANALDRALDDDD
jgi:hypothetical protein